MARLRASTIAALFLIGCHKQPGTCLDGEACNGEQPVEVPVFTGSFPQPDRAALANVPLPPAPDGKGKVLIELPDGMLIVDPTRRTPTTAAGECAVTMLACFHPPERNWAGCFANVPQCPNDRPWEGDGPMCCPAACAQRYQALLRAGLLAPRAFARAIWEAPSCMPGLAGHPPQPGARP